jgi:predicted small lipoprotein YifL
MGIGAAIRSRLAILRSYFAEIPAMRRSILLLPFCLAAFALAGCGNKGPLYLPAKPVAPAPAATTSAPATTVSTSAPAHAASVSPTPASH